MACRERYWYALPKMQSHYVLLNLTCGHPDHLYSWLSAIELAFSPRTASNSNSLALPSQVSASQCPKSKVNALMQTHGTV
jgi:hypothetical protein